ncbi:unnamed protein product, partial [Closterium sp. NIES-54]
MAQVGPDRLVLVARHLLGASSCEPLEDAVLLQHALQCGTKQWGELEKSGQLRRNNKSCCNRYIFLK